MKLSVREKVLLIILAVLLLGGGFYKYIYTPLEETLAGLRRDNQILAEQIARAKKEKMQHVSLEAEAERLNEEYNRLNMIIPHEPEMVEAASFIKDAARECGVNINSLEYEPGSEEEGTAVINVKVMAEGRYLPLLTFIKRVENASRLYMVENLSFSAKVEEGISPGSDENSSAGRAEGSFLPYNPNYFQLDLQLRTYCEKL
ncbi:Tfp pilus assembly protein PilO [Thermosyntropha lipolytica DSM 11003]|uniref:Tfp pilus assembly protein PilO n=1 Tax=Thermosyntropha lipolytica DSM 11003 TaxID=1123382 RepID=A0A1M5LLY3_9FIRM|nr:type 4a pilus biogenesis protein PilO [Thermosyntropha lipolytica]SHG66077.1 Tfp pilus assembly protein PilO [Thermosyntropha lipolytica DSM 11003]